MDLGSPVERKGSTSVGPQHSHLAGTSSEVHQAKNQNRTSSAVHPCYASWEMAPVHVDLSSDYSWLFAAGAAVG